jgi:hypothetical protein
MAESDREAAAAAAAFQVAPREGDLYERLGVLPNATMKEVCTLVETG